MLVRMLGEKVSILELVLGKSTLCCVWKCGSMRMEWPIPIGCNTKTIVRPLDMVLGLVPDCWSVFWTVWSKL